jgi:hypothetical protein
MSTPMSAGNRFGIAWGPLFVVLLLGLSAWSGAFTDHDGFATTMLNVSVGISLIATAPSWLKAKSGLGFVLGFALKLALFFALAPKGLATLGARYADVQNDFGLWETYLVYFWAMPPALALVTGLEGYALSTRLAGRSFSDSWIHRRRRVLLAITVPTAALVSAWIIWRPTYYLERIRAGDAPSRAALAGVGPRALPIIEREIDRLGKQPAAAYRSDLVSVLIDIRQHSVARRIGTPLVWMVAAAQVDVDPGVRDAVITALGREPNPEERDHIVNWMNDLDFDTAAEVICGAWPKLDLDAQGQLMTQFDSRVHTATDRSERDTSPWKGVPAGEIAEKQARMRQKLACAVPGVVAALERAMPRWSSNDTPLWGTEALRSLAALRPLPPDESKRLGGLVAHANNGYTLNLLLDGFGSELGGGDGAAFEKLVVSSYEALRDDENRVSLRLWIQEKGKPAGVAADDFFCREFEQSAQTDRFALIDMIQRLKATNPCVATTLMRAISKAAATPGVEGPWFSIALDTLGTLSASDPRIVPWARELIPSVKDHYRVERLQKVAGEAPKKHKP